MQVQCKRTYPMESISSMNMMEGAASLAITNSSRTILDPCNAQYSNNQQEQTQYHCQHVHATYSTVVHRALHEHGMHVLGYTLVGVCMPAVAHVWH